MSYEAGIIFTEKLWVENKTAGHKQNLGQKFRGGVEEATGSLS